MVDKVMTMPRSNLREHLGRLPETDLVRLDRSLIVFLGLPGWDEGPKARSSPASSSATQEIPCHQLLLRRSLQHRRVLLPVQSAHFMIDSKGYWPADRSSRLSMRCRWPTASLWGMLLPNPNCPAVPRERIPTGAIWFPVGTTAMEKHLSTTSV